jgi:hypothetical protein
MVFQKGQKWSKRGAHKKRGQKGLISEGQNGGYPPKAVTFSAYGFSKGSKKGQKGELTKKPHFLQKCCFFTIKYCFA